MSGRARRRVRAVARGRVQGVAYRAFAAEAARSGALGGWVRNLRDGGVEAVLEGEPPQVERALQALRRGPRFARVDSLEVREETVTGETDFRIRT